MKCVKCKQTELRGIEELDRKSKICVHCRVSIYPRHLLREIDDDYVRYFILLGKKLSKK